MGDEGVVHDAHNQLDLDLDASLMASVLMDLLRVSLDAFEPNPFELRCWVVVVVEL